MSTQRGRLHDSLRLLARERQASARLPGLSLAVVRDGEIVHSDAVGLADVEASRARLPDTQGRIGSITKVVTALCVLVLRDEGRLDLDDPLARYVPQATQKGVTLRRALAHLSGLQREAPGVVWQTLEMPGRDALLAEVEGVPQVVPAGSWWHYSNLAFALLGEVVASVSQMPYAQFADERVLRPLGMAHTGWEPQADAARGYDVDPWSDAVWLARDVPLDALAACGELWSTAGDLCRLAAFMCEPDERILAPATVDEMHAPQAIADPQTWRIGFGLGPMLLRRGDRVLAGHTGGMPGQIAVVAYLRSARTGAAALVNAGSGLDMNALGCELVEAALEHMPPEPPPWNPTSAPPAEIAPLLGHWWSEGVEYDLVWREGELRAVNAAGVDARFAADGVDRWRTSRGRERGEALVVVRRADGSVERLEWATYALTREPRPPWAE